MSPHVRAENASPGASASGTGRVWLTVALSIGAALFLALGACAAGAAEGSEGSEGSGVTFAAYLAAAEARSLDLQAQRETIAAARADVSIAGVRPDPQLTAGIASRELSRAQRPSAATATTAGLALTVETAGKRAARIRNAERGVAVAEAGVESFRDQLQADAAAAFVEACRARAVVERRQASLAAYRDTVRANEARLRAGDIGGLELRQSRVEAERYAADATSAAAALEVARLGLSDPLGERFESVFGPAQPSCRPVSADGSATASDPAPTAEPPEAEALLAEALGARRDVRLAEASVEAARAGVDLARRNRWVDPVVNVGLTRTPRIPPLYDPNGAVANSPAERSLALGLTVTVPIPFSRLQDGELRQAGSALDRAEVQRRAVLLRAALDVRSTLALFRAARENAERYRAAVLPDADRVLEGTRFSYRRGEATLLELLDAQRVADEVHLAWLQAVADLENAAVRLQLSAGRRASL